MAGLKMCMERPIRLLRRKGNEYRITYKPQQNFYT